MINRVSTASQYQNLTSNLMRKQGELNQTNGQLSSGKRVETAGDDPVSSVTIQNYRQQLTQIDQYNSAITLANNRLQTMETAIAGVEDNLGATKQKVLGFRTNIGAMVGVVLLIAVILIAIFAPLIFANTPWQMVQRKVVTVAHHQSTQLMISGQAKKVTLGDPEVLDIWKPGND